MDFFYDDLLNVGLYVLNDHLGNLIDYCEQSLSEVDLYQYNQTIMKLYAAVSHCCVGAKELQAIVQELQEKREEFKMNYDKQETVDYPTLDEIIIYSEEKDVPATPMIDEETGKVVEGVRVYPEIDE